MPPTDDLTTRLWDGVRECVEDLGLVSDDPGWGIGSSVYVFPWPTLENVSMPCVELTTEGETEQQLPGSTEHRERWLPMRLWLLDRGDQLNDPERRAWYQSWRKRIADFFHQRRQPLFVPEVQICLVEFGFVYDPRAIPAYAMSAGSLRLRFWVRERREE